MAGMSRTNIIPGGRAALWLIVALLLAGCGPFGGDAAQTTPTPASKGRAAGQQTGKAKQAGTKQNNPKQKPGTGNPRANSTPLPPGKVVPVRSAAYGGTYDQWSTRWWQWALSIPERNHPIGDNTGARCGTKQRGNIWFLAGTFGGPATRSCVVPAGKALFFPLINIVFLDRAGAGANPRRLLSTAQAAMDGVTNLELTIDGKKMPRLRGQRADASGFPVTIVDGNFLRQDGGRYVGGTDGYWVLLSPLPPGKHTIRFRGVTETNNAGAIFETEVTYRLTVRRR
jgi:hypothetical protein